jgi:hypothetical protein
VLALDERCEGVELRWDAVVGSRRHIDHDRRVGHRRSNLDHVDGSIEPLEGRRSAFEELGSDVGRGRDRPADEHLSGRGVRAQAGRHVERGALVSVLDGNRLAHVDADAGATLEGGLGATLLDARRLELDGRTDGLAR